MEEALRSSLRSRLEMGVVTWLGWVGPSLVGGEVTTRKWHCDLVYFGWTETASRHGFDFTTWAAVWEVATWISVSRPGSPTMGRNEVATWKRCSNIGEDPGGRDLEK